MMLNMIAIAAIAIFIGTYIRRKTENYVTKKDFDEIKRQLVVDDEIVPLTEVYEELSANRYLLHGVLYDTLLEYANLAHLMANVQANHAQWEEAAQSIPRVNEKFGSAMNASFDLVRWLIRLHFTEITSTIYVSGEFLRPFPSPIPSHNVLYGITSEARGQRTEDRGQRAEGRGRRATLAPRGYSFRICLIRAIASSTACAGLMPSVADAMDGLRPDQLLGDQWCRQLPEATAYT